MFCLFFLDACGGAAVGGGVDAEVRMLACCGGGATGNEGAGGGSGLGGTGGIVGSS